MQSAFQLLGNAIMFIGALPASGSCLMKTLTLFLIRFVIMLPGVSVAIVVGVFLPVYILTLAVRLAIFNIYMMMGGLMFLIDLFVADVIKSKTSFGVYIRNLAIILTACDNDPRAWYTTGQFHNRNRYNRLALVGACMCPCSSSNAPSLGGTICTRVGDDLPRFCPHAGVTLAYEGVAPPGRTGIDDITTDPVSEARLERYRSRCSESAPQSAVQRRLVEAVCQQTLPVADSGKDPFVAADVSAMCYEVFCSEDSRAPFCGDLIPATETLPSDVSMFYVIPVLVVASAAMAFGAHVSSSLALPADAT
jgi:hypothetical protein